MPIMLASRPSNASRTSIRRGGASSGPRSGSIATLFTRNSAAQLSALVSEGSPKRPWHPPCRNHWGIRVAASPDPQALLERVAANDDEALRELYRLYGRLAYTISLRIVSREDLAEEVVQEAFLRVWRHAAKFDSRKASFPTWFGRMVRNLSIDVLRRKEPLYRAGPIDDGAHLLSHSDTVDVPVLNRLIVRKAFLRLPPDQSRVLEMVYFGGLTHREIAVELEIPEGTVKSRLRLGLKKLRDWLYEESP